MPLDAYQVLDRVYGVITRSETSHMVIPAQATGNVWEEILLRNSNRVGVTIQNLSDSESLNLAIGQAPNGGAADSPSIIIASGGSYYANLWEDFDTPCNPFWVLRKTAAINIAVLSVVIVPKVDGV